MVPGKTDSGSAGTQPSSDSSEEPTQETGERRMSRVLRPSDAAIAVPRSLDLNTSRSGVARTLCQDATTLSRRPSALFKDGKSNGHNPACRDGNVDSTNRPRYRLSTRHAAKADAKAAAAFRQYFDILPIHAIAIADPQGLQDRPFPGPACGIVLSRFGPSAAVINFQIGIDPAQEGLAMLIYQLDNAQTLDNFGTRCNDTHTRPVYHKRFVRG